MKAAIRTSAIALLSVLSLDLLTQVEAKKHWGLCPPVDSNIKNKQFDVSKMMGIWYEYLVTPDFKNG
jgi:hypothetical protein